MTTTAPALDAVEVGYLLEGMRARYAHLSDPTRWDDGQREIAQHMAAGVKLCLDDLERAVERATS